MMKQLLQIILALFVVAMLGGCTTSKSNSDTFILNNETQLGYNIYKNYKYGYCFSYPEFLQVSSFSSSSEKKEFVSSDGRITAVASARFNHGKRTVTSLFNEEKYFLARDGYRITYEFSKNDMVVFSGFTPQNKIFYQKIVVCDLYSPETTDLRSVIARVDVIFENDDRYRGEEITELLKRFPYDKRD